MPEIIRCQKRYLAREIFHALPAPTTPTQHLTSIVAATLADADDDPEGPILVAIETPHGLRVAVLRA